MKKFYLMMALALSALTANALDTKDSNVYFDGTGWTNACVQLMIGHDGYSQGIEMSKIANTELYYALTPQWGEYTQLAIFGTANVWGGENNSITHRKNWADRSSAILNNYELKEGESNLLTEDNGSLNGSWLENGYASLNYAQKVVAEENGSAEVASFAMNDKNTTVAVDGTEIKAALTATVTCIATPAEGFLFDGWYDADGNKVAEDATYTYVCKAENTLTAKFKVDPATAIETVGADAAVAVYYNLQGAKVANPESGIFVKVQAGKATKVVL